jgi:hypothetical protein
MRSEQNDKIPHPPYTEKVTFDELGAMIIIEERTGAGRVRLIFSFSALLEDTKHHSFKNDPEKTLSLTTRSRAMT